MSDEDDSSKDGLEPRCTCETWRAVSALLDSEALSSESFVEGYDTHCPYCGKELPISKTEKNGGPHVIPSHASCLEDPAAPHCKCGGYQAFKLLYETHPELLNCDWFNHQARNYGDHCPFCGEKYETNWYDYDGVETPGFDPLPDLIYYPLCSCDEFWEKLEKGHATAKEFLTSDQKCPYCGVPYFRRYSGPPFMWSKDDPEKAIFLDSPSDPRRAIKHEELD